MTATRDSVEATQPDGQSVPTLGVLRLPRTVLFGRGQRAALGEAVLAIGRHALVCTDERMSNDPEFAAMLTSLADAGVRVTVYARTEPELPEPGVVECVDSLGQTDIDVVVGIGGGSCVDMAKVVSLLLTHGGQLSDYYGEYKVPGPILPVVAVPTTGGTGSEATPVAVIADPGRLMKVGISSPHLVPQVAICDPELTLTCPASLTAATGADALTHLVESYTAVLRPAEVTLAHRRVFVGKSLFGDDIALSGLRLMGRSLLTAHRNPGDVDARQDVMAAALAGGIALGTGGTAAAHALQYPLGAITHTAHGLGVGTLLPYVMRYNFPVRIPEFAAIARALGALPAAGHGGPEDEVASAHAGLLAVDRLVDGLGLPRTLAELGLPGDRIGDVAELGLNATRLVENNPRPLDRAAMLAITRAAYDGDRSVAEPE